MGDEDFFPFPRLTCSRKLPYRKAGKNVPIYDHQHATRAKANHGRVDALASFDFHYLTVLIGGNIDLFPILFISSAMFGFLIIGSIRNVATRGFTKRHACCSQLSSVCGTGTALRGRSASCRSLSLAGDLTLKWSSPTRVSMH